MLEHDVYTRSFFLDRNETFSSVTKDEGVGSGRISDPRAAVDKEGPGEQAARPGIFFIRCFINFRRGPVCVCTLHISFLAGLVRNTLFPRRKLTWREDARGRRRTGHLRPPSRRIHTTPTHSPLLYLGHRAIFLCLSLSFSLFLFCPNHFVISAAYTVCTSTRPP